MSRTLLGYRARATHNGEFVYVKQSMPIGPCWGSIAPLPQPENACRLELEDALANPINLVGKRIEVTNPKIVAVYLKTNGRRIASKFNRSVIAEIKRRNIDAILEPEELGVATIRFRARSGGFVWLPIVAFSVNNGPEKTRARRTVDRMLTAIREVAGDTGRR